MAFPFEGDKNKKAAGFKSAALAEIGLLIRLFHPGPRTNDNAPRTQDAAARSNQGEHGKSGSHGFIVREICAARQSEANSDFGHFLPATVAFSGSGKIWAASRIASALCCKCIRTDAEALYFKAIRIFLQIAKKSAILRTKMRANFESHGN